ncbi:hypothetical protein HKX48_009047 [Thoreauomyces humboldtii]|nr:hypothetical protein HKX48_009047 [Thoreauomyces humboldtii]
MTSTQSTPAASRPGLRVDESASRLVSRFHRLEKSVLKNLPPSALKLLLLESYSEADLCHAGEFAFLVMGLKPAVLIAFPSTTEDGLSPSHRRASAQILMQYMRDVWEPRVRNEEIRLVRLDWALGSPHAPFLCGAWLAIGLRHAKATQIEDVLAASRLTGRMSEADLAWILDYPCQVPETEPDPRDGYIQVEYRAAWERGEEIVLWTCFVASEARRSLVLAHFARYREATQALGWDLQLRIQ